MRTTTTVSVTLKPEQVRKIDDAAAREQRSRSKIVGRAIDRMPVNPKEGTLLDKELVGIPRVKREF